MAQAHDRNPDSPRARTHRRPRPGHCRPARVDRGRSCRSRAEPSCAGSATSKSGAPRSPSTASRRRSPSRSATTERTGVSFLARGRSGTRAVAANADRRRSRGPGATCRRRWARRQLVPSRLPRRLGDRERSRSTTGAERRDRGLRCTRRASGCRTLRRTRSTPRSSGPAGRRADLNVPFDPDNYTPARSSKSSSTRRGRSTGRSTTSQASRVSRCVRPTGRSRETPRKCGVVGTRSTRPTSSASAGRTGGGATSSSERSSRTGSATTSCSR